MSKIAGPRHRAWMLPVSLLAGLGALLCSLVVLASQALAVDPPGYSSPQVVPSFLQRIFATGEGELGNDQLDIDGVDDERVNVDVAVIDGGIKLDHPDLNIVSRTSCEEATEANGYTCVNASPTDGDDEEAMIWHGTKTGIALAALDNGIGEVGIAPGARLWSVDVHESSVPPASGRSLDAAIAAVKWVTAHADEIEVAQFAFHCGPQPIAVLPFVSSRCGPDKDNAEFVAEKVEELEVAVDESIAAGVVYVTPAGNNNNNVSESVPQRFEDVFTVSGMSDSDGLPGALGGPGCTDFWNSADDVGWYDATTNAGGSWGAGVDVTAPGCATSLTSTRVSGAAALLASADKPSNAAEVAAIGETLFGDGDCATASGDSGPNVGEANCNWTDNSPEPAVYGRQIKEPLLDVGDESVFDPATVPGCDRPGASKVESDVDGDGHSDLVTLRPNGRVFVYGGSSDFEFESGVESFDKAYRGEAPLSSALFVGEGHHVVDVADVTGDECADLVTLSSDKSVYVYPGKPDRTFGFGVSSFGGAMTPALLAPDGHEPIAVGDVNGDGRGDLVTYRDASDDLRVYLGQRDGTFASGITAETVVYQALHTGSGEYFVDVADVTGDGKADLVSMTTWDDVWVRPGRSDGDFDGAIGSNYGGMPAIDPAMEDGQGYEPVGVDDVTGPDGDGKRRADLVLHKNGTSYVYKGQSNGQFAASAVTSYGGLLASTTFGASGYEMIGVSDVNGDGHADLQVASPTGGTVHVGAGQSSGAWAVGGTSFSGEFKSTQHFSNLTTGGNEILNERPAYRRRGCNPSAGCTLTPQTGVLQGFGATSRWGGVGLFWLGSDGAIKQRWWNSTAGWSTLGSHGSPPGGAATAEPTAVASSNGAEHIFVRGADGAPWEKKWTDASGAWTSWTSLGGTMATGPGPAAVSPATDSVHVYGRAIDSSIHRKRWTQASGWANWEAVASTSGNALGASARSGIVDLYTRDGAGDINQRWWSAGTGWSSPQGWHGAPPGGSTSAPATVWPTSDRTFLFVRGADRALWQKTWTSASGWSAWTSLGGVLRSGPATVSPSSGEVQVFARAANDSIWRKRWTASTGWSNWEPVA